MTILQHLLLQSAYLRGQDGFSCHARYSEVDCQQNNKHRCLFSVLKPFDRWGLVGAG